MTRHDFEELKAYYNYKQKQKQDKDGLQGGDPEEQLKQWMRDNGRL